MIVGNFINVYPFGIIAVFINVFSLTLCLWIDYCVLSTLYLLLYLLYHFIPLYTFSIPDDYFRSSGSIIGHYRIEYLLTCMCGSLLTTLIIIIYKLAVNSIKSDSNINILINRFPFEILNTLIQVFMILIRSLSLLSTKLIGYCLILSIYKARWWNN